MCSGRGFWAAMEWLVTANSTSFAPIGGTRGRPPSWVAAPRFSAASSPIICWGCPRRRVSDRRFVGDGRTGRVPVVRGAGRKGQRPCGGRAEAGRAGLVGDRGRIPGRRVRVVVPRPRPL